MDCSLRLVREEVAMPPNIWGLVGLVLFIILIIILIRVLLGGPI